MSGDFTLANIAGILEGELIGDGSSEISRLSIDSRSISQTNNTLFIALDGERHDGHRYISDAYNRGIRMFLVSDRSSVEQLEEASFCLVNDTLKALQQLAKSKRERFKGTVCGITGSNGKTIVKEWIYQCLRNSLNIVRSPKSYNSQVGVPLSAWMIEDEFNLVILEAGISKPGEMIHLEKIISPEIGILTNIGEAHQENFNDLKEKLNEKLVLFKQCKKIIFCSDTIVEGESISSIMERFDGEKISWSIDGGDASYCFNIESRTKSSTQIRLVGNEETLFEIQFNDEASIENALHVVVFMLESGFSPVFAADQIRIIEPVSMRLELLKGIFGSVLVNDSYNADLAGLASAINLLNQQEPTREKAVILSDLLQSGKEPSLLYSEVAELVNLNRISLFIGIGPDLMACKRYFPAGSYFFNDAKEFITSFNKTLLKDKAILIKGSRIFKFEMITEELQQQVHQTSLMIDLNAMIQNLNYYRALLNPGVKTMVVIKALSYGSGGSEIASLLQFHNVDYLAVAFVDEGIALREAGIYLPIMVLNSDPSSYAAMTEYRLEPEIYNMEGLKAFIELLDYLGERNYPIHIKVDTGMHRLGFNPGEEDDLIRQLSSGSVRIKSVFTHLSASDEPIHDSFSRKQIKQFDDFAYKIKAHLDYDPMLHILNTSGIERFSDTQYDMVRIGIGLHGVSGNRKLIPVSTFLTRVSQVKSVSDGDTVGYSRMGVISGEREIAIIPVGYADGLNRKLSNGVGKVWINKHLAPIIGNICMDMTMIDVTGLNVKEGDQVEIFGKNQTVSKLAELLETIPYEILTGISERVKRIYIQE